MTTETKPTTTGLEIAVIGMSGRVPGSANIEEFWENLKSGKEGITFFAEEELKKSGIKDITIQNPRYVKAYGWWDEQLFFDAGFFGYTPSEAEFMDPQMRRFHECAYEALEAAGYDPSTYKKPIGLYAGASANLLWQSNLDLSNISAWFATKQLTDKDYLATRIAYKLNLQGPAITVDTACSTSLTAIHLAIQGLLSGDCDMALAGGVTGITYSKLGYFYKEGMILSSDGHTRTFDARADGSNVGDAAAVVVLKRYSDAIEDRDTIHAVVKGSAINNDGNRKAAYTAPSVDGQAYAIRTALRMAEVDPETITYVEAHGTGTTLGDPVEIEGLKAAFNTQKKHFCRIGSVKSNVGHLEIAAGVTGFIKTVLALKHKQIPPSLCFEIPNPKIDFANSPFVVNTQLTDWNRITPDIPLRAGVSSFGIGGTNVHVILEEFSEGTGGLAPLQLAPSSNRQYQLILLSARTETALEQMTQNLANHIKKHPGINLADTAYTLQVGRQVFPYRRMLVCPTDNTRETVDLLSTESRKLKTYRSKEDNRPVIFMFPGLGSQYVNMGRDLYHHEPIFRQQMDRCFEILKPLLSLDIKEIIYPSDRSDQSYQSDLSDRSDIAQLVIFIFEYALAKLLMAWGIKPHALIGYSFGEYTAACVSGVFSLKDGLRLVVSRGQLLQETPPGAMLSVPLTSGEITPLLNIDAGLSLSIDNGPSCVVSGPNALIDTFEKKMKEKRVVCMRVPAERAIHSSMMDTAAEKLARVLETIPLNKPNIPYVSNVTGEWLTEKEAVSPGYWARHLRETVRFADGMKTLLKQPGAVWVEIGPGRDISTLALRYLENDHDAQSRVLNLVRPQHQDISDVYFLLNRVGRLWLLGQPVDWDGFYGEEKKQRRRISLPTYPFERQEYRIEKEKIRTGTKRLEETSLSKQKKDIADWFYIPSWKRFPIPAHQRRKMSANSCWLVFIDECGLGAQLVKLLEQEVQTVVIVKTGKDFLKENHNQFFINPREESDYHTLFNELLRLELLPERIVHLWCVTPGRQNDPGASELTTSGAAALDIEKVMDTQDLGFYSLLNIARAIGILETRKDIQLAVVTNNMQEVIGRDGLYPGKATVLGPVKVIPMEYSNIRCRSIDVDLPVIIPGKVSSQERKLLKNLQDEVISGCNEPVIAYRGDYRWVQTIEPIRLEESGTGNTQLKQAGAYLITGGLGGIGLELAQHLAKKYRAHLVLTDRIQLPPRDQWELFPAALGKNQNQAEKIQKIKELEQQGVKVMTFSADVANPGQMRQAIANAQEQIGPLDGIIHCASLPDGEMIQRRTRETSMNILKAKVEGTLVLDSLFNGRKGAPGLFILCSSVTSILPAIGQVGYCAANAFLDAFAHYRNALDTGRGDMKRVLTKSIDWDRWRDIGIVNIMERKHKEMTDEDLPGGITGSEGTQAFDRILGDNQSQVLVSDRDLKILSQQDRQVKVSAYIKELEKKPTAKLKPRPQLDSDYAPPGNQVQHALVNMWSKFFGIEGVGIQDDFFEMGGDSLKALNLLPKIQEELSVEIPIAEFFKRPTIQKLSEYIAELEKGKYDSIVPLEKKDYYELSSAQKGLYAHQEIAPGSTAYNEFTLVILEGNVQVEKLTASFKTLIHRHESLRTSFTMLKENPVQRIHDEAEFQIEYYDIEKVEVKVEEEEQKTEDRRQTTEEKAGTNLSSVICHLLSKFVRPFDLARAPLLRGGLQEINSNQRILLIDMHHLIMDGRSLDIFIDELLRLYEGKELPPLAIQYKEFSAWQNRFTRDKEKTLNRQKEYWVNRFADKIPVLDLPFDYPRPPVQTFEGKSIAFQLDRFETTALKELASKEGVTLFMVLQGIYAVFLSRLSGQEDIVIGSPILGRRRTDLQSIIGMFVNMLVFRNFPSVEKTFPQFLKELKQTVIEALENQDYPFEELVERLEIRRDASRNPLFNVTFAMLDTKISQVPRSPQAPREQESKSLGIKRVTSEHRMSKFDLGLEVLGTDYDKLSLTFLYSTKLFKEETIKRYSNYLKQIISVILKNKNIRLKDISIGYDLVEPEAIVPQVDFKF
jgi:acyl transferase domain-containing protein/acyl carrier protein